MSPEHDLSTIDQPLRVLLSEGSSTSARQTLYAVGQRHIVDVMDAGSLSLCRFSRYVRRWHYCPLFSTQPEAYLRRLSQLLREFSYDVLFPTHEQVYLLARARDRLAERVGLALPPFEAVDQMQNKVSFIRVMKQLQLPVPPTIIVRRRAELEQQFDYPCYVKLAHGTAGSGVMRIEDAGRMGQVAQRLDEAGVWSGPSEILVQQPAKGDLCVVQMVFQRGVLKGFHCVRALAQGVGGAPVVRISVSHPQVVSQMRQLGEHLKWHGAMFVEYFYDEQTGGIQYIEANPRIGETFNAMLCGVNLCQLLLDVSLNRDVAPLPEGKIGVRSHQAFMMLMRVALNSGGRAEVLGQLWQCLRGSGQLAGSHEELARLTQDPPSCIPAAAVATQLVFSPRRFQRIVRQPVDRYSLPGERAQAIRDLPQTLLERCLE